MSFLIIDIGLKHYVTIIQFPLVKHTGYDNFHDSIAAHYSLRMKILFKFVQFIRLSRLITVNERNKVTYITAST